MLDGADPSSGWSLKDIFSVKSKARDDFNGKLTQYIHSELALYRTRISMQPIHFSMYIGDIQDVQFSLDLKYDRIEVNPFFLSQMRLTA